MQITRFLDDAGREHFGVDLGDGTADALAGSPLQTPPAPTGRILPIATRLTPIHPANIFCIGLNYRAHAAETGATVGEHPVVFMKPTTAIQHPDQPIRIPACCNRGDEVDYECELAVVIGKPARDVPEAEALDHVLGYTVANDVSARKWQKHGGGGQWVRGKSFDTFCPLGPVLVTPGDADDAIQDPQNLRLTTRINGELMQDSSTADMIFPVARLIAFLSQDTTLVPGTVILTGTPSGVGVGRTPPVFLRRGDRVSVWIERLGSLNNPVG
jgi:2-keto-4-pentenoate hydratase/2-oxohepta-3-ene-1,7-dioic acid hydratase in catechol pathway